MDQTQTFTLWSLNPSTGGNLPSYTIVMSILDSDGVSSPPSWIQFDAVDTITIDRSTAVAGTYTFMIKGEVHDETGTTTGRYDTLNFNVVVYSLLASTAVDQIYVIDNSALDYQFDAFTEQYLTEAGQTLSYTIEDTSTGGDPVALYVWLTSFDAANRRIYHQTADFA